MSYRYAVFDMDGTTLDTLADLHLSVNAALAEHGFPARTPEEVRAFVGNGVQRLIELSVPEHTPAEVREQVLSFYRAHYLAHCTDHARPYEGIPEVLRALKEKGIRLLLVSNKPDAPAKSLCEEHFHDLFDAVVGEEASTKRKPAPDMVRKAFSLLGLTEMPAAGEAVYIGDSEVDVETAANAGLDLIAVSWGFRDEADLKKAGAKTIVSAPGELLPLIV